LILVMMIQVLAILHLSIVATVMNAQWTRVVHRLVSVRMWPSIVTITTRVLQIAAILHLDAVMLRLLVNRSIASPPHAIE
jgi:uncharacterized protein YqhQ